MAKTASDVQYVAPPQLTGQPPEPVVHRGERYKITTPSRDFCGSRNGIRFSAGVGFTDDLEAARRCADLGYVVTDTAPGQPHRDTAKRWKIDCPQFHDIPSIRHRNVLFTDGMGFTEDKEAAHFFWQGGCEVTDAEAPDPQFSPEPAAAPPPDKSRRFRITAYGEKGDKSSFIHGGLTFTGGVAHTHDPAVAAEFRKYGYCKVEELD